MATTELDLAGAMTLRRGRLVVGDAAFAGRQLRLITAMLLVDRAQPVPIDRLLEALWPSGPPKQSRAALRGLVSKVRGRLADVGIEGERIHSHPGRYVVDLPNLRVDVEQAGIALEEARAALTDRNVEEAHDRASAARAVLSRPILPGVDAGWVDALRETTDQRLLESLLVLGECRLRLGQISGARSLARHAVELQPLREDAWRLAMRVEEQANNTAVALGLYEDLRQRLVDALGVDPSSATRELHGRLLQDDAHLVASASPPGSLARDTDIGKAFTGENPYVGMRPFGYDDAGWFFGREAAVQHLVERLAIHRVVVVVGPSGVGKSSLVRAGLLPALATGALPDADLWRPIVMTPGTKPIREFVTQLTRALPSIRRVDPDSVAATVAQDPQGLREMLSAAGNDPDSTTLLVVDQAEELFTLAEPDQAGRFIDALSAAVATPRSPLVLVLTLRADFFQPASRHAPLADLMSRSQFVVSPLQGDGLQAAIVEPARRAGVRLENGLVGRLVGEAGTGPSGLPLLQHALWRLWQHSEGDLLTLAALQEMGGVAGALVERAEHAWAQLDAPQRRMGRILLLRGVVPTVAGATATPVARSDLDELGPSDVVDTVVAGLVDARLVTAWRQGASGRSLLQLSHESLIGAWPRLGGWVDAQRAHLQVAARLATASGQWAAQQFHDDWLLTGRRLDDALDLVVAIDHDTIDVVLSPTESAFVAASEHARAARRQRASERRARIRRLQAQAARHLRVGVALAAADEALDTDPERTLLLCLAVAEEVRTDTPEREASWLRLLHHGLANHVLLGRLPDIGPLLAVLPGGHLVTSRAPATHTRNVDIGGGIELVDRIDGTVVDALPALGSVHATVADVDLAGSMLAVGGADGRIHLVDLATSEVVQVIEGPHVELGSVALSPDGTQVAGVWIRDGTRSLAVHDTSTGQCLHAAEPIELDASQVFGGLVMFEHGHLVDFHPSEPRLLFTAGRSNSELRVLDTETWSQVSRVDLGSWVRFARHSPDGTQVGTAQRYVVSIHDATTLDLQHAMRVDAVFPAAAWLHDGSELLSAGTALRRLSPALRRPQPRRASRRREPTLPKWVNDRVLLPVPDSTEMVTGRRGAPGIERWDVGGDVGAEVIRLSGAAEAGGAVAWSPDGRRFARAVGATVSIFGVAPWRETARCVITERLGLGDIGTATVENLTWSHDGRHVFVPASDGSFIVLDGETAAIAHTRQRTQAVWPGDVDASGDGDWIVATHGSLIEILDRDYDLQQAFEAPLGASVEAAAFSPDGQWLAVTHSPDDPRTPGGKGVTVWDWRSREVVGFWAGVAGNLSWAPDGCELVVSSEGRTIAWDVEHDVVVHELVGHRGWVQDVTHSPDGTTIATGGWDGDIRLWDAATGAQVLHFTGHHLVHRIRFHPTRPWLALATLPGHTHVWTLDTDELLDIAAARVTRDLRPDEHERFYTTDPAAPRSSGLGRG